MFTAAGTGMPRTERATDLMQAQIILDVMAGPNIAWL